LIKQIRAEEQGNILTKTLFERNFYDTYIPLVVLANTKTVLNAKYAKKEIKEKIIRVDQMVRYIRDFDMASSTAAISEKDMERLAQFFLNKHKVSSNGYTKKYVTTIEKTLDEENTSAAKTLEQRILCPKCGALMIKRTTDKGQNAGKSFYGCSKFPKCWCIVNIS